MSNFSHWLEEKFLKWQVGTGSRSTLADFAKFLGISRVSLSQYLHDTRSPNEKHLARIATQLGNEVYKTLGETNVELLTNIRRKVRKFAVRYWPLIATVFILAGLLASSSFWMDQFLTTLNQNGGVQLTELETPNQSELGEDLAATAEAASKQAQATTLAIQNLEKGDCDVLGPGNNLRLCDFSGRDFGDIDLSGANLQGAKLDGTNLSGSNLSGADLTGASLISSTLTSANLTGTILTGVNLSESNLAYANLMGAVLIGANLRGSDLTWVNFSQAILVGADLSDCNLLNSILGIDQISTVLSLENALLPKNLR